MIILLLLLLYQIYSTIISKTLPPMQIETINYPLEVYNTSSQKGYYYTFEHSYNANIQITTFQGINTTQNRCNFKSSNIEMQLISTHPSAWQNTYGPLFYCQIFVPSQRLLYSLSMDLVLTVYSYDIKGSLHKYSQIQLDGKNQRATQFRQYMILSSDQQYLYVFTRLNKNTVWRIYTNDLLRRIQSQVIQDFNFKKPILKTISHKEYIYLILKEDGLAILKVGAQGILEVVQIIKQIQQKLMVPVSAGVNRKTNLLYVLDLTQNIYVFNVTSSLKLHDKIVFSHPQNIHLKVIHNRIYFSFYERQFVVAQILYDSQKKTAILIRYYTSDEYINNFEVTNQVLILLSGRNLQIYPSNIDPRLIKKQHNSFVQQTVKAQKIIRLFNKDYLFIGKNTFTIFRLHIRKPELSCMIDSKPIFLNVKYSGIARSCDQMYDQNIPFYVMCNFTKTLKLQLPQSIVSNMHFIVLYVTMIVVFIFLMIFGYWLVKWRQGKLQIIDKLRIKIDKLMQNSRTKQKFEIDMNQQLKEENIQYNQQLCQKHTYSNHILNKQQI